MNLKSLKSVAESYLAMLSGKTTASASKPKWVPASITEENVTSFVQAVTEARKAGASVVEFNGKKYGIKSIKEDANKEDENKSKKIQDMDAENAPKQASDDVPAEVKEEDSEEIKGANVADKAADADDMEKVDSAEDMVKEEDAEEIQADSNSEADDKADKRAEMAEELSGNQKKLDVNHNGKIDGDDLKKLRGESAEADSDDKPADHAEPDADNMGGPSDHDADNEGEDDKDEDEKKEDEKPKMTGEQVLRSVADAYSAMNEESDAADHVSFDIPLLVRLLESVREDVKSDEDLHVVVEKIIAIKNRGVLTMADYDDICDCKKEESVKEETENDEDDEDEKDSEKGPDSAEAGPEVMDPATQKMKDAHNKNVEIKDGVPGSAQDGADDLNPADKPAPANKSEALPKVAIVDASTKLGESIMTNEAMTAIVSRKNSDGSYNEVGMNDRTVIHGSQSNILKKAKAYAKGPHRVELFHGDRIGYGAPHKVIHSELHN